MRGEPYGTNVALFINIHNLLYYKELDSREIFWHTVG
jgi:hypothetical protein